MGSQLLAEALRRERRFRIMGCADDWDQLAFLLPRLPDVIVLSADFGKAGGGLQTAAKIAAQGCRAALVILLDHAAEYELIVQAFRAGARGVFSRSQSLPDLCKCVDCVADGQIWANGAQMDYLLAALKRAVLPRFINHAGASLLSRRELDVARYLCDGLTNRDIARALGLSEHTVKNHLFRIYAKLGVDKRVEVMLSLMSHTPAAQLPQPQSAPPPSSDTERLRWYLHWSERSLIAQYMLGKMCQDGCATDQDSFSAYTWLLRSERGATELIDKCRTIRELLGSHLTAEQRKQAETRAARPWPRHARARLSAQPSPSPGLPPPPSPRKQ